MNINGMKQHLNYIPIFIVDRLERIAKPAGSTIYNGESFVNHALVRLNHVMHPL